MHASTFAKKERCVHLTLYRTWTCSNTFKAIFTSVYILGDIRRSIHNSPKVEYLHTLNVFLLTLRTETENKRRQDDTESISIGYYTEKVQKCLRLCCINALGGASVSTLLSLPYCYGCCCCCCSHSYGYYYYCFCYELPPYQGDIPQSIHPFFVCTESRWMFVYEGAIG